MPVFVAELPPGKLEHSEVIYQRHHEIVLVSPGLIGYFEYLSVIAYRLWLGFQFGTSADAVPLPHMRTLVSQSNDNGTQSPSTARLSAQAVWFIVRIVFFASLILYAFKVFLGSLSR